MTTDFSINKREMRANRFANMVIGMMRDYLPSDRDFLRRIYDDLHKAAYEGNLEIINVRRSAMRSTSCNWNASDWRRIRCSCPQSRTDPESGPPRCYEHFGGPNHQQL